MSQFPPPPPSSYPPGGFPSQGYPPPPPGGPQYGGPPMGGAPVPPKKSNGAAIASMICSAIFCIPGLGIIGMILGLVGLSKSKDPRAGGRGLAIAGLLVGLIVTIGWAGIGYAGWWGYKKVEPMITTSTAFVNALAAGDLGRAKGLTTSNVSEADLQRASDTIKTMGAFKDIKLDVQQPADFNDLRLTGRVIFDKGTKNVKVRITKQADGSHKISEFAMD